MLEATSEDNECSVFISPEQKRALILGIFSAYYHPQADKEIIFDTNRLWCSKLPLIRELFPIYSNPKSFVNFLLPDLNKGRVGVG